MCCPDEQTLNVPANALPGWIWCEYENGSGHLESPDGKSFFLYDLITRSPAVEYSVEVEKTNWQIFFKSFLEFKNFAEEYVKEHLL